MVTNLLLMVVGLYLTVFLAVMLLLSSPTVQHWLVPKLVHQAEKALGTKVELEQLDIDLFSFLRLKGAKVYDQQGQVMFAADEIKVNVFDLPTIHWLEGGDRIKRVSAGHIVLIRPYAHLYTRPDSTFNLDFLTKSDKPKGSKHRVALIFEHVRLIDGTFRMVDSTKSTQRLALKFGHLNYVNLKFTDIQFEGSFTYTRDRDFLLNIQRLATQDKRVGVKLDQMKGRITAARTLNWAPSQIRNTLPQLPFVQLRDMEIRMDGTQLRFDLLLKGEQLSTIFSSGRNRRFSAFFLPSQVDIQSINHFIPNSELPLSGVVSLEGPVIGDYHSIRARDLKLGFGQSKVHTHLVLREYTHADQMYIDLDLMDAYFTARDLHGLLPGIRLPAEVDRMGSAAIQGKLQGFLHDFVADARVQSPMGNLTTNAKLQLEPDGSLLYKGTFATEGLKLDSLLNVKASRILNASGTLEGRLSTWERTVANVDIRVWNSDLGGHMLDTVVAKLALDQRKVNGTVRVNDAQGNFNGLVNADLSGERPTYDIFGDVARVDLQHYGITQQPIRLTTIFNANLDGDSLDALEGSLRLYQIQLRNMADGRLLEVQDLVATSTGNSTAYKNLRIRGYPLDFRMQGGFSYTQAASLLRHLATEARLFIENDPDKTAAHFAKKVAPDEHVSFDFELRARNLNHILSFFDTGIQMAQETKIDGRFRFGDQDSAYLHMAAGYFSYHNYRFENVESRLRLSKPALSPKLTGDGQLTANNVHLGNGINFQNVNFAPSWENNSIHFNLSAIQDTIRNFYLLSGTASFDRSSTTFRVDADNSYILIGDSIWSFSPGNQVYLAQNKLLIEQMMLMHGNQRIQIASRYLATADRSDLTLMLRNVDLQLVQHFLQSKQPLSGKLQVQMAVRDVFHEPYISASGKVENFTYQNIKYGDFYGNSYWNEDLSRMYLSANLLSGRDSVLELDGYLEPTKTGTPVNLKLSTKNLNLAKVQPFVNGLMYDVGGTFTVTDMVVTGLLAHPQMYGRAHLRNVVVGIDYLQTKVYIPEEEIRFDHDKVLLDSVIVYNYRADGRYGPQSPQFTLTGDLRMKRLDNPDLNLRLSHFQRFHTFSLKEYQNDAFFGEAVIKAGWARFSGDLKSVRFEAYFTPEKGTNVSIPAYDYTEDQRLPYVTFLGGKTDSVVVVEKVESTRFVMDLNLTMTPDATVNLVFDAKAGDVISARGNGDIKLSLTEDDQFLMNGTYTVTEGDYLFTYGNVAAKRFTVDPGGSISWEGDPYAGQLSLNAVYSIPNANLSAWDTTVASVPVDVLMYLKGSVMQPDLRFGIRLNSLTQQQTFRVLSTLNMVQNDAQELNRQVFSLVMMRRVAPVGGLFGQENGGGGAGAVAATSMTEFVSSQLSNWLGGTLGNDIDVSFDLNPDGSINASTAARLFNDKVTVRRNGVVTSSAQRDLSLGNLSIEIKLYPGPNNEKENTGRLGVQVFNRENMVTNTIASTNRGLGIFYRKDFDRLRDLLGGDPARRAIREGTMYRTREQPEVPPPPAETPPPGGPRR